MPEPAANLPPGRQDQRNLLELTGCNQERALLESISNHVAPRGQAVQQERQ
jgi:hypothetical protein